MDYATHNELHKLCFSCKIPWEPSHCCQGKAQHYYVEVIEEDTYDEMDDIKIYEPQHELRER